MWLSQRLVGNTAAVEVPGSREIHQKARVQIGSAVVSQFFYGAGRVWGEDEDVASCLVVRECEETTSL